jgi:hypothetical protein|tara:strand:+ start:1429 stop:1848 length:420 start_codon:yes stop_codon:yes gene_type:complete
MAFFTREHGNAQQVFHIDTDNGSLSGALATSGAVNVTGPKLDFFKIIVENAGNAAQDLQAQVGTGLAVEAIIQNIQQIAGVYIYQVEDDTTGQISIATYPTGAYTAATLQTSVRTLTAAGTGSINCAGSDVTTGNFKLA